jgi:hypothetical protein
MKMKTVMLNLGLIAVFAGLGLTQFTSDVETVKVLGLFASGMVVGNSFAAIKQALTPDKKV